MRRRCWTRRRSVHGASGDRLATAEAWVSLSFWPRKQTNKRWSWYISSFSIATTDSLKNQFHQVTTLKTHSELNRHRLQPVVVFSNLFTSCSGIMKTRPALVKSSGANLWLNYSMICHRCRPKLFLFEITNLLVASLNIVLMAALKQINIFDCFFNLLVWLLDKLLSLTGTGGVVL